MPQEEPDIDLNDTSNEPPLVQATMLDAGKTSATTTTYQIPSATTTASASAVSVPYGTAGTTTTTSSYTVPAPSPGPGTTTTTTHTVPPPYQGPPVRMGGLGRQSNQITCPYCQARTMTRPRDQIDFVTMLIVLLILLLFWPLFWLPFVIPCCKTTEHYCGNCHRKVGKVSPCN
jgi:hypothetical protein